MFWGAAGQTIPQKRREGVFAAPDYKALYFELFRASEQAARLLWEAQQKAEQEALRADPPPLELLEPLRHRSRDATSPVEGRPWQSDER